MDIPDKNTDGLWGKSVLRGFAKFEERFGEIRNVLTPEITIFLFSLMGKNRLRDFEFGLSPNHLQRGGEAHNQ